MNNLIEIYSSNNPANVWRNYTYDMTVGSDIAKYVAREKYAFPGGCELYVITDDGAALCHDCCRKEFISIKWSCVNNCNDGWNVIAIDSTAMCGIDPVYCDHCNKTIYEYES